MPGAARGYVGPRRLVSRARCAVRPPYDGQEDERGPQPARRGRSDRGAAGRRRRRTGRLALPGSEQRSDPDWGIKQRTSILDRLSLRPKRAAAALGATAAALVVSARARRGLASWTESSGSFRPRPPPAALVRPPQTRPWWTPANWCTSPRVRARESNPCGRTFPPPPPPPAPPLPHCPLPVGRRLEVLTGSLSARRSGAA